MKKLLTALFLASLFAGSAYAHDVSGTTSSSDSSTTSTTPVDEEGTHTDSETHSE